MVFSLYLILIETYPSSWSCYVLYYLSDSVCNLQLAPSSNKIQQDAREHHNFLGDMLSLHHSSQWDPVNLSLLSFAFSLLPPTLNCFGPSLAPVYVSPPYPALESTPNNDPSTPQTHAPRAQSSILATCPSPANLAFLPKLRVDRARSSRRTWS